MTISVRQLATLDTFRGCLELQERLLGAHTASAWTVPQLAQVHESGGLLLGAFESDHPDRLLGSLVDLVAELDDYPARQSVFLGVDREQCNRGIAQLLRAYERAFLRERGVDLAFWDVDPLRGRDLHLALNKLGAISTGHIRNALGVVKDAPNAGLATDRLRIEWWLEAPRVNGHLDQGRALPHEQIRLHQLAVLTHSSATPSGGRRLVEVALPAGERAVLVEIPEDLDRLRRVDPDAATDWRLQTRDVLDALFNGGYVGVGLVHEGGRSFLIFELGSRRSALSAEVSDRRT